jgi:predicted DNA-binding antitoxin AbrB/MazE fold protein
MTKTLEATFDGAVFRPDEPVELQPNTRVQIVVTVKPTPEQIPKSFLRVARSLRLQGPADWSSRLDDYLDGGAKLDAPKN